MSCLSLEKTKTSMLTVLLSEKDVIYTDQVEDLRTIKSMQFSTEVSICKKFLYFPALGIPEIFSWPLCCRRIFFLTVNGLSEG